MTTPIRCLHVASGDLWAGAEVQLFTLLSQLVKNPEAQPHVALMNAGELATRLTQAGVPVTVLDEHRHAAPALLLKLKSLAANVRPHVIHTHRQKENVLGGIISLLGKRIPSIRTVHGSSEHTPRGLISLPKRLNYAADYACGRWREPGGRYRERHRYRRRSGYPIGG
jgi:choline dehydrogenase-like flavoprotein